MVLVAEHSPCGRADTKSTTMWSEVDLSHQVGMILILFGASTFPDTWDARRIDRLWICKYSKIRVKQPLSKRPQIGFQDQLSLNAARKHYRMLQGEHSAMHSTFIRLPFVIKIFLVLSFFERPFYTGFTIS